MTKGRKPKTDVRETDEHLFARFLEGESAPFLELFDRHAAPLGRYCRRMVGSERGAEDVMQDLWERVLRLRDKGRGAPPNVAALLYWTARNLCLNRLRHERNRRTFAETFMPADVVQPAHEASHLEELIVLGLESLPPAQREVLVLHVYSGYTFEQIAGMTGEKESTVRTRAWRARRQLKRELVRAGVADEGPETN